MSLNGIQMENGMRFERGFTLIELLVVVAIIALLLAIALPGYRKVHEIARTVPCLANQRTLSLAWMMYAEDNNGEKVNGGASDKGHTDSTQYPGWVRYPCYDDGTYVPRNERTLEQKKRGIMYGALWPYIETIDAYHCPGDRRNRRNIKENKQYFRSYSQPRIMTLRGNKGAKAYELGMYIKKVDEVMNPADSYIFLEQADFDQWTGSGMWLFGPLGVPWGSGTYLRSFLDGPDGWRWIDPLGYFHTEGNTLGFADGHGEKKKWKDSRTRKFFRDENRTSADSYQPNNPDIGYMHRSYPRSRSSVKFLRSDCPSGAGGLEYPQ
jgi:prepilin-type N-terminal cleavage/methylation domain-containing protein